MVNNPRCLLWPLYYVRQALDPSILFTTVTAPILSNNCTRAVGDYSSIQLCGGFSISIRLSAYGKVLGSFYPRWVMHWPVENLGVQRSDELIYGYLHVISSYFDDVECANRKKTKICGDRHFPDGRIVMFYPIQEYRQKWILMLHSVTIASIIRLSYIVMYRSGQSDPTWSILKAGIWA